MGAVRKTDCVVRLRKGLQRNRLSNSIAFSNASHRSATHNYHKVGPLFSPNRARKQSLKGPMHTSIPGFVCA